MTIEIHEPELEALIDQRMASGVFETIEDALLQALRSAPAAAKPRSKEDSAAGSGLEIFEALQRGPRTGADIVAAFRACPHPDFMPEIERMTMPVRDVDL